MKLDREHAWTTIVGWYGLPGAAEELLRRQQEEGLDVVWHLFQRYLESELGVRLSEAEQREAQNAVQLWREQVIHTVRELRRALKTMPGLESVDDSRHAWRESLKGMEVKAERVEFMSLCNWFEKR